MTRHYAKKEEILNPRLAENTKKKTEDAFGGKFSFFESIIQLFFSLSLLQVTGKAHSWGLLGFLALVCEAETCVVEMCSKVLLAQQTFLFLSSSSCFFPPPRERFEFTISLFEFSRAIKIVREKRSLESCCVWNFSTTRSLFPFQPHCAAASFCCCYLRNCFL